MAAPQHDVGPDDLLDHVHNRRVHGQVQKSLAATHAFIIFAFDVGADEFFRAHTRVVAQQGFQGVLHFGQRVRFQPIVGHQTALGLVLSYILWAQQMAHGCLLGYHSPR